MPINSKWIRDRNVRAKIIKILAENTGNSISDLELVKDFKNRTKILLIKEKSVH